MVKLAAIYSSPTSSLHTTTPSVVPQVLRPAKLSRVVFHAYRSLSFSDPTASSTRESVNRDQFSYCDLTVISLGGRNFALTHDLLRIPLFTVGNSVRVYNAAAMFRQGVKDKAPISNPQDQAIVQLGRPLTGLAIGPTSASTSPDKCSSDDKQLCVKSPLDLSDSPRQAPHDRAPL